MSVSLQAQDQLFDKLEGRIYSQEGDVAATHILNITSNRFTIANSEGFFEIPVKLYDTFGVFSSAIQDKENCGYSCNFRARTFIGSDERRS